jgi:hypothetical protein
MDIDCFTKFNYSSTLKRYLLENPIHKYATSINYYEYVVQKDEEMRLDLIIQSIYNDVEMYKDADIILYINGIDNPLNIRENQVIKYVGVDDLIKFRYTELGGTAKGSNIKQTLAIPSKTTRTDKNRTKFIESDYTLPPVLMSKSDPAVKINSQNIIVGGLK